jgi:flavin-dependent dehydrogenase
MQRSTPVSSIPDRDYEVAVFGGGPAGASAAALLARRGRRVILFERDRFPRFHIGESLLPSANGPLAELGLQERVRAENFPQKWGATFTTADGTIERYADFSAAQEVRQPQTWQVPRARFDQILLEHAEQSGVSVRHGYRVVDVRFDGEGVTVAYTDAEQQPGEVRVEGVIDATGRPGVLARKLDLRVPEPRLPNIAVFSHYAGVPRQVGRRSGDIRIVARPDLGWFWLIPIDERLTSVGVVLRRPVFDSWPRMSHEEILAKAIDETPAVAALLADASREWPVRVEKDFSYSAKAYAGDRWLLAGDAGAFLDPVFSTGVAIALESGVECGREMDAALFARDFRVARFAAFDRRQGQRYRAFRRFVLAFYTPHFRDIFFQEGPPPRLFSAVLTLLAGLWRPRWRTRWLIHGFFCAVWLQRFFALVPRIPMHSEDVAEPAVAK